MARLLRLLPLAAAALVVGGCSAADGGPAPQAQAATSPSATPRVVRVGVFDNGDANRFNRAVAEYNAAAVRWQHQSPACQRVAKRLHRAGRSSREVLRCHRIITTQVVRRVGGLRRVVVDAGGDWTPGCVAHMVRLRTFITRFDAAWRRVDRDFADLVAERGADLDGHVETARLMAMAFARSHLPATHAACLTQEDSRAGMSLAAQAERQAVRPAR